jgi:trehalose-6-phosphate synthase
VQAVNRAEVARLCASLLGERLVIGVDRLDYSKGLDNRLRAFDLALGRDPSLKCTLRLLQIAVLSRSGISAYRQLRIRPRVSAVATSLSQLSTTMNNPAKQKPVRVRANTRRSD